MLGGKFTKKVKVGGRVKLKLAGTQRLDRFGVAGGCHSTFPEVTRRYHGQLTRVGPARAPVHPQTYSVALRWRECSSKKRLRSERWHARPTSRKDVHFETQSERGTSWKRLRRNARAPWDRAALFMFLVALPFPGRGPMFDDLKMWPPFLSCRLSHGLSRLLSWLSLRIYWCQLPGGAWQYKPAKSACRLR